MNRPSVQNNDKKQDQQIKVEAEYIPADGLLASTTQIWKSRIGWRITFMVFMTIVMVYSVVLMVILSDHRASKIASLEELALSTISPLIDMPQTEQERRVSPVTNQELFKLFASSKVTGLSIYTERLRFIENYGEKVTLIINSDEDINKTMRPERGLFYEFVLTPTDLRAPYYITARVDAEEVSRSMNILLVQNVAIAFLVAALVTNVLMMTLGRWLLIPILTLRQNLIAARKHPERPYIQKLNISPDSEIGGALEAAETLILQNAKNLKQIKTKAEGEIHRLAYYDTLTGLPNRELFHKVLRDQAGSNDTEDGTVGQRLAVMALDLDHFKDINDSMGHHIGDVILRSVGERIVEHLPKNALVSRYGEDQYAIMLPIGADKNKGLDIARNLASIIRSEPIKAFDEDFQIRCSMGLAIFPDDSSDPEHVVKGADIALNRAKEDGRDTIRTYSKDFDIAVKERFQTLRDLRVALAENQLRLFYQPQFELKTGKLVGVECLIRWLKPDEDGNEKFIPPGAFIPIAENSGLIIPMGEWIIRHACERGMEWKKMGLPHIRIAVNVSGAQFMEGNLVPYVQKTLEETGFPAHDLELEVTESLFMDDIEHTIKLLHEVNRLGIELAIDDFGTGYSSLSYLRQFPIDRLKIDRSFVDSAVTDPDDAAIARTIIGLGRSLNLEVIAEGVETLEQQEFLINEGCDLVQGFRYAKPLQEHELIEFLKKYTNSLSYFDGQP